MKTKKRKKKRKEMEEKRKRQRKKKGNEIERKKTSLQPSTSFYCLAFVFKLRNCLVV